MRMRSTTPPVVVAAMLCSTAALMVAALLLMSLAAADTYEQETRRMFVDWKAKHGKIYDKDFGEGECRYAVFKNTRRRVERARDAGVTTSGLNSLSGLSREEIFLGYGVRIGEASYEEETRRMFVGWKAKYGKTYRDVAEEECRYALFKGNRRVVVKLNAAGETAYGLNQFGDLTNEEVRAYCYRSGGGILEMEGELSARCQAVAPADLPDRYRQEQKLIWLQVCRCIAVPVDEEALMWI